MHSIITITAVLISSRVISTRSAIQSRRRRDCWRRSNTYIETPLSSRPCKLLLEVLCDNRAEDLSRQRISHGAPPKLFGIVQRRHSSSPQDSSPPPLDFDSSQALLNLFDTPVEYIPGYPVQSQAAHIICINIVDNSRILDQVHDRMASNDIDILMLDHVGDYLLSRLHVGHVRLRSRHSIRHDRLGRVLGVPASSKRVHVSDEDGQLSYDGRLSV